MQLAVVLVGRGDWVLDVLVVLTALAQRPSGWPWMLFAWRTVARRMIGGRRPADLTAPSPSPALYQPTQTNEKDGQDIWHNAARRVRLPLNSRFCLAGRAEPTVTAFTTIAIMDVDPIKPAALPSPASSSAALAPAASSMKSPASALPSEHVGSPTAAMDSPVRMSLDSAELRKPAAKGSHSRSMSLADVALQAKRLSLHFPVQNGAISQRSPPLRSARPTSWALDPIASALGDPAMPSPTEGNFLTIIASQERRVLELKDELKHAEEELKRLKDHYRKHEAFKKKNETSRRAQQLQPLDVSLIPTAEPAEDDPDGSSQWMQREMERRKMLMTNVRSSNRKVFSGSRHTRTLSLLSPERTQAPPFPQPADLLEGNDGNQGLPSLPRTQGGSDMPSPSIEDPTKSTTNGAVSATITRDALLKTGKQMAADLREGLWTFVEDLRQATVGDEGINGTTSRSTELNPKQSNASLSGKANNRSVSNPKSKQAQPTYGDNSALIDIGGSFWRDNGLESAETSPTTKKKVPAKAAQKKNRPDSKILTPQKPVRDFEESWDTWDTPVSAPPESGSSNATDSVSESSLEDDDDDDDDGSTNNSSARTSASLSLPHDRTPQKMEALLEDSNNGKRDAIPWPSLAKLSPGNIKRTATQLMNDFEKSLSPTAAESKERTNYVDAKKSTV